MQILKQLDAIVVEDDVKVAENLTSLMAIFFSQVRHFNDAESALEYCKEISPSVILSDIELPGRNGLELIKEIRRFDEKVQAIILTSFVRTDYLMSAIPLGVVDYIEKPISYNRLKDVLTICAERLQKSSSGRYIINEHILFDADTMTIFIGEKSEKLSKREAYFLRIMCENRGKVVSNEFLYEELWTLEAGSSAGLRNLILRVRKKLGDADIIKNHSYCGYILE